MGVSNTLSLRDLGAVEPPKARLQQALRMAARLFDVPVVAVNLVDDDFQFTVASVGGEEGRVPRNQSICATVVDVGEAIVIADAHGDPRFREHPAVRLHPRLRFYAGAPLKAKHGLVVGALCIADERPRELSEPDLALLTDLAAWMERELTLERDLMQAAEVQRHLLPTSAPDVPGLEAAGRCVSARDVGGDLFDWQLIDGSLQVSVFDAMGKGIPGAIVSAEVRAVLRGATRLHDDLASAIAATASSLEEDLEQTGVFVTLFAARIDPQDATVEYVDAGHNLAVIASAKGPVRHLASNGLPLGISADEEPDLRTERLGEDEFLLVVSDGILDIFPDAATALERVSALARENLRADDVVNRVVDFAAHHNCTDDVTVVAVRRSRGQGSA